MRLISRKGSILGALALTLALGMVGTASANDVTSRLFVEFTPSAQSAGTAGKGALFIQTSHYKDTDATTGTSGVPAEGAERLEILLDDDFKLTVNSKLPKCTAATLRTGGSAGAPTTTQQALQLCSKAQIGAGSATASIPGLGERTLTVTSFNGETSVDGSGTPCVAPDPGVGGPEGCEFIGGRPTVLIHSRSDALGATNVIIGEIQSDADNAAANSEGENVGNSLYISDVSDIAGDAGALTMFSSVVTRSWTNGKSGKRKRTYNFATAKCATAAEGGDTEAGADTGGQNWDAETTWLFDDESTDFDKNDQECWNKVNVPIP